MKQAKIILTVGILFAISQLRAQDLDPIRFTIQPSFGATIPIKKIQTGAITDHLIGNKGTSSFYCKLALDWYGKNWGLGVSGVVNEGTNFYEFDDRVSHHYRENYYTETYLHQSGSIDFVEKVTLGPSYKIEKGKFVYIYRLQLGRGFFPRTSNTAFLKEKNTNKVLEVEWTTSASRDVFVFNPSFTLGYRIKGRALITLDLNYTIMPTEFTYEEKVRDTNTKTFTTKKYNYGSSIHELSVGVSVALVLFGRHR